MLGGVGPNSPIDPGRFMSGIFTPAVWDKMNHHMTELLRRIGSLQTTNSDGQHDNKTIIERAKALAAELADSKSIQPQTRSLLEKFQDHLEHLETSLKEVTDDVAELNDHFDDLKK